MNRKQLIIYTVILIFICSIGSTFVFKEDPKPQEMHTPQRKIERQLSNPDKAIFNHTQIDDPSVVKNETSIHNIK